METVVLFGLFWVLMCLRIPVFLGMLITIFTMISVFPVMPKSIFVQRLLAGIEQPALSAIPYFFLVGTVLNASGLSRRLLDFAQATFGGIRGTLAQVNVGGSMLFGGMSGSAAADVSAIGSIMIPAMKEEGYSPQYAAAITATSAGIGLIIPPSIPMVLFGLFNNVSVGQLFIAGLIPGVLMGFFLMAYAYWHARHTSAPAAERANFRQWWYALKNCFWVLLLPVVVFLTLAHGLATITEVAAVAVLYAIIISTWVYRQLTLRELIERIIESAQESGQILSLFVVAGSFLWILSSLGVTEGLTDRIGSLELSATGLLFLVAGLMLALGTMVGPGLQMILLVPILYPMIIAAGVDALHFGVVSVLACSLGLVTPPIGFLVYLTAAQAKASPTAVYRECLPILLTLLLLLTVVILVPSLSTYLPSILF